MSREEERYIVKAETPRPLGSELGKKTETKEVTANSIEETPQTRNSVDKKCLG